MKAQWRRYLPLYALVAITLLPIVGAYLAYYVVPPSGRTNYGTLIEPQRPAPVLALTTLDGAAFDLRQLRGHWAFVMVDASECDQRCADKLLMMRQQRSMTGRQRDQIDRIWFIPDTAPLPIVLMREYEGTYFIRAPLQSLRAFLALPDAPDARLEDHIWVIDPNGNLMLRWPKNPEIKGVRRDVAKLLKVAAGWIRIDPRRSHGDAR